jgi:hypothetical protein
LVVSDLKKDVPNSGGTCLKERSVRVQSQAGFRGPYLESMFKMKAVIEAESKVLDCVQLLMTARR